MQPLKAIRKQCLFCMNGQSMEITKCPSANCILYDYRFGKNKSNPRISALQAIKKYCFDCSRNSHHAVKTCSFTDCSLFHFRSGKNPFIKKGNNKGNIEALQKWRESQKHKATEPF